MVSSLEKKKMIVYAHYYVPDVAATGQILRELAEGLKEKINITVICVVPSYEGHISKEYNGEKKFYNENINGIRIIRVKVPEFTKEDKKSRVFNLLMYYIRARKATRIISNEHFDYVFTISQPPIMGGMLGVYGKNKLRKKNKEKPKLIYNIHDLNPEQTKAVDYISNKLILKTMMAIDICSCRKSDLIITIGNDMVETIKARLKNKQVPPICMINNWIDEKNIYPLPYDDQNVIRFKEKYHIENSFVIMYSGNLGLYYDLENLIKLAADFKDVRTNLGERIVFAFVGAGSILDRLKNIQNEMHLNNVVFIPYQKKQDLIYSLNAANVQWCVNAKGIKGVSVPSKVYGIMAVGKPVLGVMEKGSEARIVIEKAKCGLVSEPQDYDSIARNIHWFIDNSCDNKLLQMGENGREYLLNHLTMDMSIEKYSEEILSLDITPATKSQHEFQHSHC